MKTKTCSKCGHVDDAKKFHGLQCFKCRAEYGRKWRKKSLEWIKEYRRTRPAEVKKRNSARATKWNKDNPDKRKKHALNYYYRLQDQTIMAYGGYVCACCGETEPLFLTLDHINNDGGKFRKKYGFKNHGPKFYKWLRDNGYPSGYQVLCSNCNHGKHRNKGICPHQET